MLMLIMMLNFHAINQLDVSMMEKLFKGQLVITAFSSQLLTIHPAHTSSTTTLHKMKAS